MSKIVMWLIAALSVPRGVCAATTGQSLNVPQNKTELVWSRDTPNPGIRELIAKLTTKERKEEQDDLVLKAGRALA